MRKPTKSSLKRKLDKEVSRIVRARGNCAKCGETEFEKLQAAHIFSRSNHAVRFDLDNVVCLCSRCHWWGHKNPVLFGEFVIEYLGELKYEALKQRALAIKKWSVPDYQSYLEMLQRTK